jgi:hypothetical protein
MLLNQTPLLDLHYDPATDVLRVTWPDVTEAKAFEIEGSLQRLKTAVSTYFVKRLLVDASQTTHVFEVDLLLSVWRQILEVLQDTGLRKIARIRSQNPTREAIAQEAYRMIDPEAHYPQLLFTNFNTEEEAMKWLLED